MKDTEKKKSKLSTRIIFHSLRIPLIYIIFGIILIFSQLFKNVTFLPKWNIFFAISVNIGNILITIGTLSFFYKLIKFTCLFYEKKLEKSRPTFSIIIQTIRKSMWIIFILTTISVLITISAPYNPLSIYASNIIAISIILSLGWLLIQILRSVQLIAYKNMRSLEFERRIQIYGLYTKLHILRNVGVVVVALITIAAILMTFSSVRNIGISVLASAGFLTAIVGLSGKNTFVAVFSGLQIAITQPIKLGDMLYIDDEWGIVEKITFTYVTLKMRDQRKMIVPIDFFVTKKFENWTRFGNSVTASIHFKVDYMMPVHILRNEMDNILKNSSYWDGNSKKLMVYKIGETSVDIRVQISTTQPEHLSDFKAEVREKFLEFMRANYPLFLPTTRQITVEQNNRTGKYNDNNESL